MNRNLENLLNELLEEGKIRKQETDTNYVNGLLHAAYRNFLSAEYNCGGGFPDTAFKSAYDGILQISRAILLLNGYRPDDGEQHKTTFLVAGTLLGERFLALVGRIDKYRVKRNNAVYQPVDMLSKSEALTIIASAREYWGAVRGYFKEKDSQLELFDF